MNPVPEFEQTFARKLNVPYAIAVNSGTSALHAALVALDVRGGEVIMPALCPAMDAFAIIHAGALPVFADVDPNTHLVTHETLAQALSSRTRVIIAVALHGLPCDIDPILALGVPVIEDCAQALLARYKNGYAGTKAHIGCYSFEKKKHMTTGSEGGMIVTSSAEIAMRARKFAGIGYKHMTAEAGRTSLSAATFQRPDYERFDTIGLNYRMSEAQAVFGLQALQNIDAVIEQRQKVGFMWQEALGCQFQPHDYDADNTFYSAAWMPPENLDWIELYERFVEAGGDGFYAMPKCPFDEPAIIKWQGLPRAWRPYCPIAQKLQQRLMLFKTHYLGNEPSHQTSILKNLLTK